MAVGTDTDAETDARSGSDPGPDLETEYPDDWQRYEPRTHVLRFAGLLVAAVLTIASWRALNVRYEYVRTAPEHIGNLFQRMYPPDTAYAGEIVTPMLHTINIAVIGTLFAILMALPVAYIGARNTTPNRYAYAIGKFIIAASRSVHSIVWALIFVIMFSSTSFFAGIMAISFRSIGFVAKLLSEEIEEIDETAVEAIAATGGNQLDVLVYGIVPQIKAPFVGIALYRWDINVREATIIGLVGAGGIGFELNNRVNAFDWPAVLTILLAILAVVTVSELLSVYARAKVR